MSSSRSTGCPPREARGVCPPLPRGDTRKLITECPPREARGVLLAKHGVSACLYHAATDITMCPSHRAMSQCVCHRPRNITRCVHDTVCPRYNQAKNVVHATSLFPPTFLLCSIISLLQHNITRCVHDTACHRYNQAHVLHASSLFPPTFHLCFTISLLQLNK